MVAPCLVPSVCGWHDPKRYQSSVLCTAYWAFSLVFLLVLFSLLSWWLLLVCSYMFYDLVIIRVLCWFCLPILLILLLFLLLSMLLIDVQVKLQLLLCWSSLPLCMTFLVMLYYACWWLELSCWLYLAVMVCLGGYSTSYEDSCCCFLVCSNWLSHFVCWFASFESTLLFAPLCLVLLLNWLMVVLTGYAPPPQCDTELYWAAMIRT